MSDDTWEDEERETNESAKKYSSITRHPNITEHHNTIFDMLRRPRCRYILYYLFTVHVSVIEFEAVVDAVCRYESAGTESSRSTQREYIRIDLHHTQLPRLAEEGILDYDRRQGTIRFHGSPALEEWTEHARFKELD